MIAPKAIYLEGIDGSGKSTVAPIVAALLRMHVPHVVLTCLPCDMGDGVAQQIREWLACAAPPWRTIAAAFAYNHQLHADRVVAPTISHGGWVVCDRSIISTMVYQTEHVGSLATELVSDVRRPANVALLDLPADVAAARLHHRTEPLDAMERGESAAFRRARYKRTCESFNTVTFDATQPPERVARDIVDHYMRVE